MSLESTDFTSKDEDLDLLYKQLAQVSRDPLVSDEVNFQRLFHKVLTHPSYNNSETVVRIFALAEDVQKVAALLAELTILSTKMYAQLVCAAVLNDELGFAEALVDQYFLVQRECEPLDFATALLIDFDFENKYLSFIRYFLNACKNFILKTDASTSHESASSPSPPAPSAFHHHTECALSESLCTFVQRLVLPAEADRSGCQAVIRDDKFVSHSTLTVLCEFAPACVRQCAKRIVVERGLSTSFIISGQSEFFYLRGWIDGIDDATFEAWKNVLNATIVYHVGYWKRHSTLMNKFAKYYQNDKRDLLFVERADAAAASASADDGICHVNDDDSGNRVSVAKLSYSKLDESTVADTEQVLKLLQTKLYDRLTQKIVAQARPHTEENGNSVHSSAAPHAASAPKVFAHLVSTDENGHDVDGDDGGDDGYVEDAKDESDDGDYYHAARRCHFLYRALASYIINKNNANCSASLPLISHDVSDDYPYQMLKWILREFFLNPTFISPRNILHSLVTYDMVNEFHAVLERLVPDTHPTVLGDDGVCTPPISESVLGDDGVCTPPISESVCRQRRLHVNPQRDDTMSWRVFQYLVLSLDCTDLGISPLQFGPRANPLALEKFLEKELERRETIKEQTSRSDRVASLVSSSSPSSSSTTVCPLGEAEEGEGKAENVYRYPCLPFLTERDERAFLCIPGVLEWACDVGLLRKGLPVFEIVQTSGENDYLGAEQISSLAFIRALSRVSGKSMWAEFAADMSGIRGSFRQSMLMSKEPYIDFRFGHGTGKGVTNELNQYQFPFLRGWLRHAMKEFNENLSLGSEQDRSQRQDPALRLPEGMKKQLFHLVSLANATLLVSCVAPFPKAAEELLEICLGYNKYLPDEAVTIHLYRLVLIAKQMYSAGFMSKLVKRVELCHTITTRMWENLLKLLLDANAPSEPAPQHLLPSLDPAFGLGRSVHEYDSIADYNGPAMEVALMKWFSYARPFNYLSHIAPSYWTAIECAKASSSLEPTILLAQMFFEFPFNFTMANEKSDLGSTVNEAMLSSISTLNIIDMIWDGVSKGKDAKMSLS